MPDDMLRELAMRAGIAPEWTDQAGVHRQVSPESLRAILGAMGIPANPDAIERHPPFIGDLRDVGLASRFVTARTGQPVELPLLGKAAGEVKITTECGERRVLALSKDDRGVPVLPALVEPGYHTIHAPDGDITIAAAPQRCVTFADLNEGTTGWGLAAQIYSLRSESDGGIGTFAAAAALGRAAAARGADALAISPVHALYGALPAQFSPYSPSTRLFYNPLHADPAASFPSDVIREVMVRHGLAEEMARLSALPRVDWLQATPLRQRLLRALFDVLHDPEAPADARAQFERFAAGATPLLRDHAVFEVLHAVQREQAGSLDWRDWPAAYRNAASQEVAAFATARAEEIRYQLFLQWLTGQSYSHAQQACRDAGMKVGLIADLAIGMDRAGSHAWSRQSDILIGLSIGAPPDYYAVNGQDWGLTTFSPRGLAATGYAPFIDTLRANLRHAGGIRIDHVMGMSRLWLIPEGASALDGAYVSFPAETMFRLIALESWRHRAIVIGEDLGTLPHGFRDYLREQGVAGLRVLRFERSQDGYVPPWNWDPQAVALTSTHDLVPTAGWWAGVDLDAADGDADQHGIRAWDRGVLWGAMRDAGLVAGERPAPDDTDPVVDAAVGFIAATPCTLKIIPVEDALGITTQPNVPGTTVEKPNWSHRLAGDAGNLLDDAKVSRRLAQLGHRRD